MRYHCCRQPRRSCWSHCRRPVWPQCLPSGVTLGSVAESRVFCHGAVSIVLEVLMPKLKSLTTMKRLSIQIFASLPDSTCGLAQIYHSSIYKPATALSPTMPMPVWFRIPASPADSCVSTSTPPRYYDLYQQDIDRHEQKYRSNSSNFTSTHERDRSSILILHLQVSRRKGNRSRKDSVSEHGRY